jgi:hypothetical protein
MAQKERLASDAQKPDAYSWKNLCIRMKTERGTLEERSRQVRGQFQAAGRKIKPFHE